MSCKFIFSFSLKLFFFFSFVLLISSFRVNAENETSQPFQLRIDFSKTHDQNQNGYQPYLAEHENHNSFEPQKYLFGNAEVTIDADWPADTKNTAKQMIDRGKIEGNEKSDLLRDWLGTDGRASKVPLTLTISNLPPGLYKWKSYHHDSGDQTGTFDVTINDANGKREQNKIDITDGKIAMEKVTVLELDLKSNGEDLVLSFKNDMYPDNSTSFFLINGFELSGESTDAVPEPVDLVNPKHQSDSIMLNPKLDWSASYYASQYKVYFGQENPPRFLDSTTHTEYSVTNLIPGTTYYWYVEAINANGLAPSEVGHFTTVDSSIFAQDFELKVDFGKELSPLQNGYGGYTASHENGSSFIQQDFEVSGRLVQLDIKWAEGTVDKAKQMIDRGGNDGNEDSDLLRDWIGTDGTESPVPLILTLKGVPKGVYEWKSFHNDFTNQNGVFSATYTDAKSKQKHSGIGISTGDLQLSDITTLKTIIESDGSDIVVEFEMDDYPSRDMSFFVMNGFVLDVMDTTILPGKVELVSPLNRLKHLPLNTKLQWTDSYYANYYNLYLGTDNPPVLYATSDTSGFEATNLQENTSYYWYVEAVNNNGVVKSKTRSFTTKSSNQSEIDAPLELSFSHKRGFYNDNFGLEVLSNFPDVNIIYTSDCSTPSIENGQIYTSPIAIDSTTVIKAVAIAGDSMSDVYTQSYLFPDYIKKQANNPAGFPEKWGGRRIIDADYEMDPEVVNHPDYADRFNEALMSVPSLSLTMSIEDWFNHRTGLYVGYPNTNVTREKAVTAEFLFKDKENFAIECGVQNQGGTSIVNWKVPKQSMRLLFKKQYGPTRLRYKLFPDSDINSINTLVVDGFLYGWVHPSDRKQWETSLFFRDQLAADMHKDMGQLSFHGMYVHLFINGLYWGMYDLHERPDDAFMSEYMDAEREEFEILKHNKNNVVQGTNEFYLEMLEVAREGLSTAEGLEAIQKYLDLPAFIDYMALNFYLGNFDWAHQNWYAARNKAQNGTFKYFVWDAEHVMRYSDISYNSTLKDNSGGPTEIHTLLKENEEYRMMFADAVYKHFFDEGALSIQNFKKRFLERKNEIEGAVILESARWGDHREEKSNTTFTLNDHWLPEVNRVLENYIPFRRDTVIKQLRDLENLLFPECMPPVFVESKHGGSTKQIELDHSNLMKGKIYFTIDGSDPRMIGGAISGIKYTGKINIDASTTIKARYYCTDDGTWSALAEKTFLFEDTYGKGLVINEIMYHPEEGKPEFIEIMNAGESFVDMNGFYLEKGIEYTFGRIILPQGAGVVLSNDTVLFRNTYGFSAQGQYEKKLSNRGETILLRNNFGQLVDSISYSDTVPWPEDTDGDGYSLELLNSEWDNALAQSWKSSYEKGGTPFHPETRMDFETVLYPNPFESKLNILIKNQRLAYERFEVEVFSQMGSKVYTEQVESYSANLELNLSNLAKGLYLVRIKPISQTEFNPKVLKAVKMK